MRARTLRRTAFGLMAVATALTAAFVIGETAADPGGWAAVGLITAWAAPLAGCALVPWRWPDAGTWLLGVLTAALIGGAAWFAVDPGGWRHLENGVGPVRVLATVVVTGGLAVLGLRRTAVAGILLVVAAAVPVLLDSGRGGGLSSLAVVAVPALVSGVLYLLAAAAGDHPRHDEEVSAAGPPRSGR